MFRRSNVDFCMGEEVNNNIWKVQNRALFGRKYVQSVKYAIHYGCWCIIRRSQWVCIKSSWSRTNLQELCSLAHTSAIHEPIFDLLNICLAKLVLDHELFIQSLTPSDDTSVKEYCIFNLKDIFLAQEYSILNFLYRLIDTFWC